MARKVLFCSLTSVALAICGASAAAFNPSEADIESMVEVTTVFGPTQLSSIDAVDTNGPGINLDVSWRIGSGGLGGETFSRVVMQREGFDTDVSGSSSFNLIFEPDHDGVGVKPFIQTGDDFAFFETDFVSLPANQATQVSLDLTGVPNTNNIRQFGFQLFGPAPAVGEVINGRVRVSAIPEPSSLILLALAIVTVLVLRSRKT